MAHGNLVLCRNAGQSVFIGSGEHQVTVTVVDTSGNGTLSFREKGNVTIKRIDSRIFHVVLNDIEDIYITTVEANTRCVKLAFQAEKYVPIDREEIREAKIKG
jgi:sRNA-binding carbon storage regulator CsrA